MKHYGKVVCSVDGFDVIECEYCGFKHIMPLPSEDELQSFYKNEFYTSEKPDYFAAIKRDKEWWSEVYNNYYDLLEELLPGNSDKPSLLDVGCGPGFFLKIGKEKGWNVSGVEPSPLACEFAKGEMQVNVVNEMFDTKNARKYGEFDVVCMLNVLEHIANPVEFIKASHEILKSRGLIFIRLPNDFNKFQEMLVNEKGFDRWWVVPRHHINYFDFDSASRLLIRNGFEIVYVTCDFPMDFFLVSGLNYVKDSKLGTFCHNLRKEFEITLYRNNKQLINSLYSKLSELGLGRNLIVIGRKRKINEA